MEGSGETAHAGGEGEVGVGQGRADQVSGVGGDVASLVVTKNRKQNCFRKSGKRARLANCELIAYFDINCLF